MICEIEFMKEAVKLGNVLMTRPTSSSLTDELSKMSVEIY